MVNSTRISLLTALRATPGDNDLWRQFDARYGDAIRTWASRQGLQAADAADVAQSVMVKLFRALPLHTHDPGRSFRRWLKAVVNNAARDLLRKKGRRISRCGLEVSFLEGQVAKLSDVTSLDVLARSLDSIRDERLQRAMAHVKSNVDERSWRVYWLAKVRDWTTADIAAEFNMSHGAVYQAKYRVGALLRKACASVGVE